MTKISDLPGLYLSENYFESYPAYLIVNAYQGDEPDTVLTTGVLSYENLIAAYLSAQFYYESPIQEYIHDYLFGEDGNMNDIMESYLSGTWMEPTAMEDYLSTYMGSWATNSNGVTGFFENSEFSYALGSFISDYLSSNNDYAGNMFQNDSFTSSLLDYVGDNLFPSTISGETTFSNELSSWMSYNMGNYLSDYMYGGSHHTLVAELLSAAISDYYRVYDRYPWDNP